MSKLSFDRILQSQGFGTRKYCRELIQDGEVTIDGEVHDNYKELIETQGLVFTIFEEAWTYHRILVLLGGLYVAINRENNLPGSRKPRRFN